MPGLLLVTADADGSDFICVDATLSALHNYICSDYSNVSLASLTNSFLFDHW